MSRFKKGTTGTSMVRHRVKGYKPSKEEIRYKKEAKAELQARQCQKCLFAKIKGYCTNPSCPGDRLQKQLEAQREQPDGP